MLNSDGRVVETFHGHGINGPWDMTAVGGRSVSALFVTNVLNGTVAATARWSAAARCCGYRHHAGTRAAPADRDTTIGSGFPQETNSSALVIGPTGVGLGRNGTLYVADTLGNRIAAIPNALLRRGSAGTGLTVSRNGALAGPLGVAIAPNGNILAVNSLNGKLVEIKPNGSQVAVKKLDTSGSPPGAGALFGLAVAPSGNGVYFVDDATNTLDLLH